MQKTAKTYSELAYKKMFTPVNLYAEGLHTYPLFAYKNPILNNFCAQNVCKSMQKYSWFAYILHTFLHTTPSNPPNPLGRSPLTRLTPLCGIAVWPRRMSFLIEISEVEEG